MSIRPAAAPDAASLAALHAGQIGEGFLSSLGPRFLVRLYRRMTRTPGSFVLVADEGGRVVGFVAGSVDTGGLYRSFLLRDGPAAALASPGRLLSSWRRVLETLGHARADDGQAEAELLAIAVDPACRRRGIAASLVDALLGETRRRNARSVDVVVGADNLAAVSLYRRAGFVEARRFEFHAGTPSLVLRHQGTVPDGPADGQADSR